MFGRRNSASYKTRFGPEVETIQLSDQWTATSAGTQTDQNKEMAKGFAILKHVLLELVNRRVH